MEQTYKNRSKVDDAILLFEVRKKERNLFLISVKM